MLNDQEAIRQDLEELIERLEPHMNDNERALLRWGCGLSNVDRKKEWRDLQQFRLFECGSSLEEYF